MTDKMASPRIIRRSGGGAWREFLDWSFKAPQTDKRLARTTLVVSSAISVVAAFLFLMLNLI